MPGRLNSLGNSLMRHFATFGELSDLNRSIELQEDAVKLSSDEHPDKPNFLNSLACSLVYRFEKVGDLSDINKAVQAAEDAVNLTPDGHPDKPARLINIANSLLPRSERLANLSHLDKAIQIQEAALQLLTEGHPDKHMYLHNIGTSLTSRFEKVGNLTDLERSIQVEEDALQIIPEEHPNKHSHLNNLGTSLLRRFQRLGEVPDVNRSIQLLEEAVNLVSDGHPDKPARLCNLGNAFYTRFNKQIKKADLHAAASCYSSAAYSITGPTYVKFTAAYKWMECARSHLPDQTMQACTTAMDLIPELTWLGSSIRDRHHQVIKAGRVARDAAAIAIEAAEYRTAVEWLEQGRSVIWSQLLQLRSPVDELRGVEPELAERLQSLSFQLEGTTSRPDQKVTQANYHKLALEREELLKQIRRLDGFGRFLLPKTFSQLLPMADRWPIVMLNISEIRCDALALVPGCNDSEVLQISLQNLSHSDVLAWRERLQIILVKPWLSLTDLRKAIQVPDAGMSMNREEVLAWILKQIWERVMEPVLRALAITVSCYYIKLRLI